MDRFGKFWKPETMVFTNDHWRGSSIFQSKSTRQSREKIKCSAWGSHLEFHLRKRRHGCWDKAKQKDKASDDDDDGLPNLNFDHRTLVIREALIDAARAYKPSFNWSQILVWSNSFWTILCVNELYVKRLQSNSFWTLLCVNELYVKCPCVMRQARNPIISYLPITPLQNDTCT